MAKSGTSRTAPIAVAMALAIVVVGALLLRNRASSGASAPPDETAERAAVSGAHADIVRALEAKQYLTDGQKVRDACAKDPSSCSCRTEAAHRALDRGLGAEALAVIRGADEGCRAGLAGAEAEALARSGKLDEASEKAAAALVESSSDGYASYALAEVAYSRGDVATADAMARQALGRGRGSAAHLLLGLIAFRNKDLAKAENEFSAMLAQDAKDVDALFNLAVVAGAQNQYRKARERYLEVLKVAPAHADARYNLALLTHSVGAMAEAQHHLEKLKQITAPDDPRVIRLEGVLNVTARAPAASASAP